MAVKQFPPEGVHGAEFNNSIDTLWLWIQPQRLDVSQVWKTRGDQAITATPVGEPYKFLMPTTYSEVTNHEWDKFESVGVKFNELAASVVTATQSVTQLKATTAKADAPLYYKDSGRREWTFEFLFMVYSNAYRDVWLPIQEFLRMSAPATTTTTYDGVADVGIEIPYLFSLQTRRGDGVPVPLLDVREACVTSIQPKYDQPYIKGYPAKAELTITFKDMNVLFRDSYRVGSDRDGVVVNIQENGE